MYKNLAFIAYKSEDECWAKHLECKLRYYKFPGKLHEAYTNSDFIERPRMVIRDSSDLNDNTLTKTLSYELSISKYLIVLCSFHSAYSKWDCKEIQYFINSGREEYIIPVFINYPSPDIEKELCYPSSLLTLAAIRDIKCKNWDINNTQKEFQFEDIVSRLYNFDADYLKKTILDDNAFKDKSVTLYIGNTGETIPVSDIFLDEVTNTELLSQLMQSGLVPNEIGKKYHIIGLNNQPITETEYLSYLGFCYGDTITIISKPEGGGGNTAMAELVFNPLTGEFETDKAGSNPSLLVTEMTSEGFAGPLDSKQSKCYCHEPTIWNRGNNHPNTEKPSLWSRLFTKKNKRQTIYSSVFAPAEIAPMQHLVVQVYLHLQQETDKVKELATEADKSTERRGYEPLEVKLKKGDNVEIELNVNGNTLLYNSRKSLTWHGAFVKRSFDYLVPSDIDVYELSCSVNVFVNGAVAGEMIFITDIVDTPRKLNTNIIAKPTKKLFISYSHKDIKSAERIAKIHEALGIDVFFDKHRLKAGYIYSEEISRFIQTADTFVLCWSENAAESDYVEKERKEALSLAYPQTKPREQASLRIHPYNIEPHATPPADMIEHYHFEEL